jgi:hypothetical protein
MDIQTIREHLALANRHAAEGALRIERQRTLLVELERDGHDTTQAFELLSALNETQAAFIADRERIRAELEEAERPDP